MGTTELLQAPLLIAGAESMTENRVTRRDPSTGIDLVTVAEATAGDVDRAVAHANDARQTSRGMGAGERAEILTLAAQELAGQVDEWALEMARETGKPVAEARPECLRAVEVLRYHAGQTTSPIGERFAASSSRTNLYTERTPVGVVALITPWNFPAAIPAWKLAPALAAGNAAIIKLSGRAALTGLRLARALLDAGLPPGTLQVTLGDTPEVGRALVAHPGVAAVSFTGSTAVGREVVATAASRGARVQAEMGGHAPLVVMPDADLGAAVAAAAAGAFASAGQKCTSTRRVYVADSLYEDFVDLLCERVSDLRLGPAEDPDTTLGPLVDSGARDSVLREVTAAASSGNLRIGGDVPTHPDPTTTAYLRPAVLTDLPVDAKLATTEVFGPAVAVWPMREDDDFVELANRTEYGLAAAIYTNDLSVSERFVRETQAGLLHVNSQTAGAEVHVPFGGHSTSGYGTREQGREAYAFFTEDRTIYVDVPG